MKGFMKNIDWEEAARLIKLVNDWFDLFNARSKFGIDSGKNAFGTDIEKQITLLNDVNKLIMSMRVGRRESLLLFQKGILLSNSSLVNLFEYLKSMYKVDYIITYRLKQDLLENFFFIY